MKYPSLPIEQLDTWAHFNGIKLHDVEVRSHIVAVDGADKGGGIVAAQDLQAGAVLISVPQELILTQNLVKEAARTDQSLRELLAATDTTLLETPRTVVMLFLLFQLTCSNPGHKTGIMRSVKTPLTDYIKFLPKDIPLPTFYSLEQREAILGTSLEAALEQKFKRLEREFVCLRSSTQNLRWCQTLWWNDTEDMLTLDDWKTVDAMYRSRAFELPGDKGNCMTPVLDMVNHASNDTHNARFEVDQEGNIQLVVRDDVSIKKGEEITIMYGCGGACEMIFSYGFLENEAQSAREVFLDLEIPDDDPLKVVKTAFAEAPPGVRIYADYQGHVKWESSLVWWACVNEEDGLEFRILQQNDGSMELSATWRNLDFRPQQLGEMLREDPASDIFLLRALVLVQNRVAFQGERLADLQEGCEALNPRDHNCRILNIANQLRRLEMDLLGACYRILEEEKTRLSESNVVRAYLSPNHPTRVGGVDEDFS